mmetsp:Transcript_95351/g.240260  ORF Transcript_95351/g.240260 Transcript_95351/m.240260 type:complete len:82 (-) Transcript_95351:2-247(-)
MSCNNVTTLRIGLAAAAAAAATAEAEDDEDAEARGPHRTSKSSVRETAERPPARRAAAMGADGRARRWPCYYTAAGVGAKD